MKKKFRKKLRAFSLIELSVVILIIGILVAGAAGGAKMINVFRLQTAQNLTLSSPVITTKGLVLWLESSMPESFLSAETEDGAQLTRWLDRNPQVSTKLLATTTASSGITLKAKSNIYSLPAVYFNGSSAAVFTLSNGTSNVVISTPNSAYTFFIVAKLNDDLASNVKTVFANGSTEGWGYGVSGTQNNRSRNLIFAGSSDVTSATANATTKPEIISATYAGGANGSLQLFTNGTGNAGSGAAGTSETLSSSSATAKTPVTAFYIGNKSSAAAWSGEVSEIIIFNRVLSKKERNQIELYLGQKYNIKVVSNADIEGCAVNIAGILTTHVSEGSSTLTCDANGYSGTVPYDCYENTLTTSANCGAAQCEINGQTGITNGTTVAYGSTSTACDIVGYLGTVTYNSCTGGAAVVTANNCTPITCTAAAGTGYTAQSNLPYAASGNGNFSCDVPDYNGTINYTCVASGLATSLSGTCSQNGRWELIASNVYKAGTNTGVASVSSSNKYSVTCDSSNNGRYLLDASSINPIYNPINISGRNISSDVALTYWWFDCYCTGSASCSLSCPQWFSSTGTNRIYRCTYP